MDVEMIPTDPATTSNENGVVDFDVCTTRREDALLFSEAFALRHVEQRTFKGLSNDDSLTLSISRLQLLNELGRESLGHKLTRAEFRDLLSCFRGRLFYPILIQDMELAMVNYFGEAGNSLLCNKLSELSELELFALADLIEQCSHRQCDIKAAPDIAEALGLVFA